MGTNSELYHFGIKGMKWGVRRYQNEDGSLTPAGKKRYADDPEIQRRSSELKSANERYNSAKKKASKAANRYNLLPTRKNLQNYESAMRDKNLARTEYDKAKLGYETAKEAVRIRDKGVTFKNKSKHRLKLEEQYLKAGMSKEDAEAAANNRIRTERVLAVAGAMTVAACVAYVAHTKYKNSIDQVIKSGETLQRIEMQDTGGQLHDMFYVAKGRHDSKRYKNLLGMTRQQQTGQAYVMKLQAARDVKVASKDKAAQIFGDLYKNDDSFRTAVESSVKTHFSGRNAVDTTTLSNRNIRKMYENFNSALIDIRDSGSGADKKFYEKLKNAGYGAIQDVNDMKFSGYHAKNPLIVFDNSGGNIMVESFSKIEENLSKEGSKELLRATGEAFAEDFLKKAGPLTAGSLVGAAAFTHITSANQKEIDNYKKAHPGTKLNDQEILKMLLS